MKQKITNMSYMSLLNQINEADGQDEEELKIAEVMKQQHREIIEHEEDKVNRAIELYKQGIGTLGYLSENIGILKQDLIYELRIRNIEPNFSEFTLQEELS